MAGDAIAFEVIPPKLPDGTTGSIGDLRTLPFDLIPALEKDYANDVQNFINISSACSVLTLVSCGTSRLCQRNAPSTRNIPSS